MKLQKRLLPIGSEIFWGEIAPNDHVVEIYSDDSAFLDSLAGFAAAGISAGESVVIIATPTHRDCLDFRLRAMGLDLDRAIRSDVYIALDARDALATFMVDRWPDSERFRRIVSSWLSRARGNGRRVRAFGEMVALLWADGLHGATVRLEHLWSQFCEKENFPIFCAYPKSGFTKDAEASIQEICSAHSRMVSHKPPHLAHCCAEDVAA